MDYIKLEVKTEDHFQDILIGRLSLLGFEAFQEHDLQFDAWIANNLWSDELEVDIKALQKEYEFSYQIETIKHQNWNAKWEADYEAICIDDFCAVRASFHDPYTQVKYEIIIDPKMAFGTGHHATTTMVMEQMREIELENKKVLDYGCGTGILAILASMMGAKPILAIDYDKLASDNTLENVAINKVENIEVAQGDINYVKDADYDVILANINRNVILQSIDRLNTLVKKNGILITSGYLPEDENIVKSAAEKLNFSLHMRTFKENWLCLTFIKN